MPRLAFVAALPLLLGCTANEPEFGSIGAVRLERCTDTVPADLADRVGCATIEVPQVHADPSGPKLELRVFASVAVPARGREPVIYLTGGPGMSAGGFAAVGFSSFFADTLDRDVVLLEQRGNALSRPALDCKLEDYPEEESTVRQCIDDVRNQGARVEAFNTIESAHDIDDLRRAIGVEKVFVWGASYGSLLAGAFAREHPDNVAGLVLESSILNDRTYRTFERASLFPQKVAALTKWLSETCVDNATCREKNPMFNPERELSVFSERLKTGPVALSDRLVIDSPERLDELLFLAMYNTPNAVLLLRAIWASNTQRLADFAGLRIGKEGVLEYLERILLSGFGSSTTTNFVVNCYDATRNYTDEGIRNHTPAAEPEDTLQSLAELRALCNALPPPTVDQSRFNATAGSTAPTLFLGSQLDPVTPIEWAREDKAHFPNSYLIAADCMGHGVVAKAYECYGAILRTFVDHPERAASATFDQSCVTQRCTPDALTRDLLLEDAR